MKVSKQQLQPYNIPAANYFTSRAARNTNLPNPSGGDLCAIAAPGADITDELSPIWDLEQFNGLNWVLMSLDPTFALVVTNDGLKAVTNAQIGGYLFKLSSVKIRQNVISSGGKPLTNWTHTDFSDGSIALNTNQSVAENPSFSMSHNIGYRINMSNGGIQYSILLDIDTLAYYNGSLQNSYSVGAIGLYVEDPENNNEILFAIGNLSSPIYKYATTPNKIGNSLKLYLNTTLSNLGYISDLTLLPENVRGIPEVVTEEDLKDTWDGISTPHNVVLVDNLHGTNIPAIAVRTGDPVVDQHINWMYITPTDDSIKISNPALISSELKDYMAAAWDPDFNNPLTAPVKGGYVPANGDIETLKTQGIKIGQSIVYAGVVKNLNSPLLYNVSISNAGEGYHIGDSLIYRYVGDSEVIFEINITKVGALGQIQQFICNPQSGNKLVNVIDAIPEYRSGSEYKDGVGFRINISSEDNSSKAISWDFPNEWVNKPLYVDTAPNVGRFTLEETESFVGWCISTNSIKLALDLRNEANYINYGTTRYANTDEVGNMLAHDAAKDKTTLTPAVARENFLQRRKVAGNPGESLANPVTVDSYVKFNQTVVGKGISEITSSPVENVSFFGLSYRAWWGDLAEYYTSDKIYKPGTLITIGDGLEEITIAKVECNGIVSTKPGYELGDKKSDKDLPIALVGKVPVRFASDCVPRFGDRIYLSKIEQGHASTIPNGKCLGKIIDKREDLSKVRDTILCSVRVSF